MQNNLLRILEMYGFSDKEAKVYLSILELGNTVASVIARRSGIKRATVYSVLEELKKRGVAFETFQNEIKYYSVINPDILLKNLEEKYKDFQQNLPEFMSLVGKYGDRPRMQFFEGREAVTKMLYEYADVWIENMKQYDQTRRGYQDHYFIEEYIDRFNWYWAKKVPGERIYLFSNQAPIEEKIGPKLKKTNQRIIKTIEKKFSFTSTIWINGDYIVMVAVRPNKHYAFQIQDKEFAANLREVFKVMRSIHEFSAN